MATDADAEAADLPQRDRDAPWVMRTYSGHSTARASNELYRTNLAKGQTGLSIAFDLPTQTGYDPDAPEAAGEVGKVGVPVAHLDHGAAGRRPQRRRRLPFTSPPDEWGAPPLCPGPATRLHRPAPAAATAGAVSQSTAVVVEPLLGLAAELARADQAA